MHKVFIEHFRLVYQLWKDKRVPTFSKALFLGLPVAYALFPSPDDFLPVIGLLDDCLVLALGSVVFRAMAPRLVVAEHIAELSGTSQPLQSSLDEWRHPNEIRYLAVGFASILAVLLVAGVLGGFVLGSLYFAGYLATRFQRARLLSSAVEVSPRNLPHVHNAFVSASQFLPSVDCRLLVTQDPKLNAFVFGYGEPYCLVLTSGLVDNLSAPELQASIGHELGHVLFGHVRVMSLLAGPQGPSRFFFYQWSRLAEHSADAVGCIACGGDPVPLANALVKISGGPNLEVDLTTFIAQTPESEQLLADAAQLLSTHPFTGRRIRWICELFGLRLEHAAPSNQRAHNQTSSC